MKDFFKTKYRVVKKDQWYIVQEHNWWDLIYGWWRTVGSSTSIEGAKEIIRQVKEKRVKHVVVHEE